MTAKQQKFCETFATGESATTAYIDAYGGKVTTARTNAARLLTRPDIEAEVQRLRSIAKEQADAVAVLSINEKRMFLAGILRTDITQLDPADKATTKYIKKITRKMLGTGENAEEITELEGYDKIRAIQQDTELAGDGAEDPGLARLLNLFSSIPQGGKVIPNDTM